jgi:hypothetical protein
MEIVSASQALMFKLLLFNVIFSLNHIKNHPFMFFDLLIFLWKNALGHDIFSHFEGRLWNRFDLEIYYCTSDLYGFGLTHIKWQTISY